MKKWQVFTLTFLLGSALAWSTVAVAHNPRVLSAPFLQFSPGLRLAFANSGSPGEIEALKKRVVRIFEAHIELGNLSPNKRREIGSGLDAPALEKIKRTLQSIDSPKLASENLSIITDLYAASSVQDPDLTFDNVDFVVDQWQGVSVSGNEATVQFIGGVEVHKGEFNMPGSSSQWLVTLVRDSPSEPWLMSSRKGIRIGG